jgi:hypothetical protein
MVDCVCYEAPTYSTQLKAKYVVYVEQFGDITRYQLSRLHPLLTLLCHQYLKTAIQGQVLQHHAPFSNARQRKHWFN